MKKMGLTATMAACALLMAVQGVALGEDGTGQGQAVVTILTKHNEVAPVVSQQDVSVKVNGKDSTVTGWQPFKGGNDALELVLLIDSGARNLGRQIEEIGTFIQNQGPHTKIAVAYMQNGRAVMAGPLSADHKQASTELHLPAGPTTNPYFSITDLAQNWPSQDRRARREVVLFSDGVDPNNRRFDPDDPYVQAAIRDSVKAGLVIYTVYWRSGGGGDSSMTLDGGQSLLSELSQATGGYSYWSGTGNPVSFQPFFEDVMRRLENQYGLEFTARLDKKPTVETLKVKVEGIGLQVTAPQQVFVDRAGVQ
ncbi:MAG: hypothetical protein ABSG51_17120 [Terracidiphilus sp.]|jgi:hypothetical protein